MAAELITIVMTGLDGTPYQTRAWKTDDGYVYPVQLQVGADGQPIDIALEEGGNLAAVATAAGAPADGAYSGSGAGTMVALLKWIGAALAGILKFGQPDVRLTGVTLNMATANAAVTIALANAQGTIAVQIAGLTAAGGSLAVEASNNGGSTWSAKNALVPASEGTIAQSLTADGGIRINCAGHTHVRLRVSSTGSGNATIDYSASAGQGVVSLGAAVPPGNNTIGWVLPGGSSGRDYGTSQGTLPNIGGTVGTTPFGGSGPYAAYILIRVIPANPSRSCINIENISGSQIAVLRDDGTAGNGSPPTINGTVFSLGGGVAAGTQGGSWTSRTFKGRVQLYAPSAAANVAVMED